VVSQHGAQSIDPVSGDRYVTLEDGYRYTGIPGNANYDVVKFDRLVMRASPPVFNYANTQRSLATTQSLLGSSDPHDQAELQSRIAAPVSVLIITLLAVPLSYLAPRKGRYSKLVLGLCAWLAYQDLLSVGQAGIGKGHFSPEFGLWSIHALVATVALTLIGRQQGWFRR
jgi:lipopolysaccharide export system permease protein